MARSCFGSTAYFLPILLATAVSASCESSRTALMPTPSSIDSIVGSYALQIDLKSECSGIPEVARRRSYSARFDAKGSNSYVVTLSDATFFEDTSLPGRGRIIHCGDGLSCSQFQAWREGEFFRFELAPSPVGDADGEFFTGGGTIVELIPPDDRLNISGTGVGSLEGTRIDGSLNGHVSYCPSVSNPPRVRSWGCIYCADSNLRLTFVRK